MLADAGEGSEELRRVGSRNGRGPDDCAKSSAAVVEGIVGAFSDVAAGSGRRASPTGRLMATNLLGL